MIRALFVLLCLQGAPQAPSAPTFAITLPVTVVGLGPFVAGWDVYPIPTATFTLYVDGQAFTTLPAGATQASFTLPNAGTHRLGITATIGTFETLPPNEITITNTVTDPCLMTIVIANYTNQLTVGDEGEVRLRVTGPSPVTLIEVRLGTQVVGLIAGAELRFVRAIGFGVPRTAGTYPLFVFARDVRGCTTITTLARPLTIS